MPRDGSLARVRCRTRDFSLISECRCLVLPLAKNREGQSVLVTGRKVGEIRHEQNVASACLHTGRRQKSFMERTVPPLTGRMTLHKATTFFPSFLRPGGAAAFQTVPGG